MSDASSSIGNIEDGNLPRRFWLYLKLAHHCFKRNAAEFYIFGSDLTFLVPFCKGRIFLEVADLRSVDMSPILRLLFHVLDRWCLPKSTLLNSHKRTPFRKIL